MNDQILLDRVFECARVAAEKRGSDLLCINVGVMSSVADYFLLVSASSDRRVQTIAETVIQTMREQGVRPLGVEGLKEGRWVLIDYGAWVVHVFYEETRQSFDLEGFWFDAPRVEIPAETLNPPGAAAVGRGAR